ncbi:MAG: amidohydrolase family protein [Vicinamibacterales bacterium]
MHAVTPWIATLALTLLFSAASTTAQRDGSPPRSQPGGDGPALYHGARLIFGDERPPLENGALLVADGRITAVGRATDVIVPPGARRVALTGKTIVPALVNVHAHVGYERYRAAAGESRAEHFTPENLHDHLQRQAYYGVGSVLDAGSGALPITQPFQAAQAAGQYPDAADLHVMGGVVPVNGGPDHILIKGTRPLSANYEVTLSPEGRAAIRDLHARRVRHVKIWLGDRGGTYPAMPHEVYDAVIDEAHRAGIKVHAHATTVRDQKDAIRAGVDLLVHTVQNAPLDDELLALLKAKRPYWTTVFGLGDRSEVCDRQPFALQLLTPAIINDILATDCGRPVSPAREALLAQNFKAMIASGVRLVLGTDAGVWPRYTFGTADHHELERYVQLGLSPAEAIVAATARAAEAIGLTDVGVLRPGYRANFVVLEANPLDDIRHTRRIDAVYLRGQRLDRQAMLTRWTRERTPDRPAAP